MNNWGSYFLLIAAPVALVACGDASDTDRVAQAGAAGSRPAAGGDESDAAGTSGLPSTRGGSSGSSCEGASGSSSSAGKAGSSGEQSGGGSGTGGVGGSGGASLGSALLLPVLKAFCDAARDCCSAAEEAAELDECESSLPRRDATFAVLDRGTATIDQAGLAGCLAAYQQAATKCEANPVLSACQGLVHGTRKENEACADVGDCARAQGEVVACVIADPMANEGVCAKVPHGQSGDTCLNTCRIGETCSFTSFGAIDSGVTCFEQEGLYCSSDVARCVAITALGAPCSYDECGSQNYCDDTCKKRSGLGEACTQTCLSSLQCINDQCRSPSFVLGSTCSGYWLGPY